MSLIERTRRNFSKMDAKPSVDAFCPLRYLPSTYIYRLVIGVVAAYCSDSFMVLYPMTVDR